jgi:DNA-binding CsgD family transcriptional regulator
MASTRNRTPPRSAPVRASRATQDSTALGGVLSPELRRFFDAMASHFPGHVMQRLMRPDGTVRYTYVGPGLAALGLDGASILSVDTSPQDWIHPDDAGRWRAALTASAATLEPLDEEVRVIGMDGRVRWVRSIGNPRRISNGDTVWDGIALDVTEKREALDALRFAKAEADAAEAQKARLLSSLTAVLETPHRSVQTWLGANAGAKDRNAEVHDQLTRAASAIEQAVALLKGAPLSSAGKELSSIDARIADLTPRQRDVLVLLGEGQSNRQIAERLQLTEGTIKLHVGSLLKALGVTNRTQAAAMAVRAEVREWQHAVVPPHLGLSSVDPTRLSTGER